MSDPQALIEARHRALQKLGRNVVNFQKMELMLKGLLKLGSYSSPISQLASHFDNQERRFETEPMGKLVERAGKSLSTPPAGPPDGFAEPWVTAHFTVEGENWGPKDWRREMRQVVRERNHLIHRLAATFDQHSIEKCEALSIELDAQRERMLPAYRQLESMLKNVVEFGQFLAANSDTISAELEGRGPSHDA